MSKKLLKYLDEVIIEEQKKCAMNLRMKSAMQDVDKSIEIFHSPLSMPNKAA